MEAEYEIAVLDSDAALTDIREHWQAIEDADTETTPFNTHAWLSLWWKYYKQDSYKLHIVIFSLAGNLVAIAPLYIRPNVQLKLIKEQELRWLGSGSDTSPDYLNIVCTPKHRQNIVNRFVVYLAEFGAAQRINLTDVAKPSLLYDQLHATFSRSKGVLLNPASNLLLNADLPGTWDEYRMALSRKRRKQINHRRNRLDRAGDWLLYTCESDEQRYSAVRALEELHRQRWISKGQDGGFASDAYIHFHRDVIDTFAARNQLWLVTLNLNGETIGVLYLFLWRNTLLFFQSGFSPEHESLSPGHVMFTHVIGEAIECGIKRIDLLKGDYQYKKVYAKTGNQTSDLLYIRPGLDCAVMRSKQIVKSMCG